jgi:hypothetical protein
MKDDMKEGKTDYILQEYVEDYMTKGRKHYMKDYMKD